jgi:hypothetical protein
MRSEIAKRILEKPQPKYKVKFYWWWQLGCLISFGTNFERRRYICFDLPFCTLQILGPIPEKKRNNDKI